MTITFWAMNLLGLIMIAGASWVITWVTSKAMDTRELNALVFFVSCFLMFLIFASMGGIK